MLYGFGIGVGVSVVAFCCRSPTIYSSISCSRRRRPPPASRPSSFRLRLQRCGMRERARQLEAKTHLWGGRGTWDKSWKWSLLSAIGQNSRLIVCQRYCYSTICNSMCNRVKKRKTQFHKMRLLRFRSLRKIFRSNVGCADLSQAWWCCLPLSDWHVPLSLPRRTTQAQSRATAKTRIVFQSILPKTLSSVYLVRQTTLLGFVLSIGGPACSLQVNHLRQEDLLVTLEPKPCQEKASMSHLSIAFYISVVANS